MARHLVFCHGQSTHCHRNRVTFALLHNTRCIENTRWVGKLARQKRNAHAQQNFRVTIWCRNKAYFTNYQSNRSNDNKRKNNVHRCVLDAPNKGMERWVTHICTKIDRLFCVEIKTNKQSWHFSSKHRLRQTSFTPSCSTWMHRLKPCSKGERKSFPWNG